MTSITVEKFMTTQPNGIGPKELLGVARDKIRSMQVRHLPVLFGGVPVGVLSDRDVSLLADLGDVDFDDTSVKDVMTPDPYCVSPSEPLSEVAKHMATLKIGSALVTNTEGKLVGIFTYTDALNALSNILEELH